ncbi:tyrosine-type recombinase/integrase [Olivibacter sitiensis]|uniref:tyrosine-type recombinase/integrase n=1 Tax=Olivibacter sitiensis TaxID=376470 RepID=UPI0004881834|nr:tyrosine-type recombinase/integrase [Olivibacter sitiensis]
MGSLPKYKEPKIIRAKRGWFIALYYLRPDSSGYKRFELSGGINYVHDLGEREKEIQAMLKFLKKELEQGFNPFFPDIEERYENAIQEKKQSIVKAEREMSGWDLLTGLEKFTADCRARNLAERTVSTYESFINNIKEWIEANEKVDMRVCEATLSDMLEFLDTYYDEEGWSPRTYNNHAKFLVTLFGRLKKLEKRENPDIEYRIDLSDIELKKDRAEKNRYYTPAVAERVKKELEKDSDLYNYVKWIFYSCMRPREIRLLQVKHIDLNARQIKAIAPTAKTGDRYVPISDELMELIQSMSLTELPLNFYVFGRGNKPSEFKTNKDGFSVRYKPIKDQLGLDNKYTLYGWKHTRVVNLLMAGFSDQEVMTLTGHTDYQSFMAYKRELMVDSSIMKGKTISL